MDVGYVVGPPLPTNPQPIRNQLLAVSKERESLLTSRGWEKEAPLHVWQRKHQSGGLN